MYSFEKHYESLLGKHYTRLFGGDGVNFAKYEDYFRSFGVPRVRNALAVDLGAGSGFQSIPLARLGCDVVAIDLSRELLGELDAKKGTLPIRTVRGDILDFDQACGPEVDYAACMTDVISHLNEYDEIKRLFEKISARLRAGGYFFLSYRDNSAERAGTDRFIPFHADDGLIMTTFIEPSAEYLSVTDIVHLRDGRGWRTELSSYRKLRMYPDKMRKLLSESGLGIIREENRSGMIYCACGV